MGKLSQNALRAILLHISNGNQRFPVKAILPYDDLVSAQEVEIAADYLVSNGVLELENIKDRALLDTWYVLTDEGVEFIQKLKKE